VKIAVNKAELETVKTEDD